MAQLTLVKLPTERNMVRESKSGLMDQSMLDNGIMTWLMEQVFSTMLTEMFMNDPGLMTKHMVMVHTDMLTEQLM